jgi:hypothetical protein
VNVTLKGESKRHVSVRKYRIDRGEPQSNLEFYSVEHVESEPLKADLAIAADGRPALAIETPRSAKSGRWKAAVCDANGAQLGVIEIEL